jgi:hypothetical protein
MLTVPPFAVHTTTSPDRRTGMPSIFTLGEPGFHGAEKAGTQGPPLLHWPKGPMLLGSKSATTPAAAFPIATECVFAGVSKEGLLPQEQARIAICTAGFATVSLLEKQVKPLVRRKISLSRTIVIALQ